MKYLNHHAGAGFLFSAFGALVASSCVIRIGPGDGETSSENPSMEGSSGQPGATPQEQLTPEQLAAMQAFAAADPQKVALANTMAGYTNYLLWGTIEAQGYDPATTDPEAIRALIDETLPWAQDEAKKWIATVDPAILLYSPEPKYECVNRFGCPQMVYCEPDKIPEVHACVITDCDNAKCRPCPDIFNLGNLVINSWCSYVCVEIAPELDVVGYAVVVFSAYKNLQLGPYCVRPW